MYFLSFFAKITIQIQFLHDDINIWLHKHWAKFSNRIHSAAKYFGMQLQYPVGHVSDLSHTDPCVYTHLFPARVNLQVSISCRLHRIGTARMRRCVNVKSIFIGWCNPLHTIKLPCKLLLWLFGKINVSVFCFRNVGDRMITQRIWAPGRCQFCILLIFTWILKWQKNKHRFYSVWKPGLNKLIKLT